MKNFDVTMEQLARIMLTNADVYDTDVYCVFFYDEMIKLLKELMVYDEVTMIAGDFEPEDYNYYDKEYYICLDTDFNLSIEKAWHEANEFHDACYYMIGDGFVFISGDANSSMLKAFENCKVVEVDIKKHESHKDAEHK